MARKVFTVADAELWEEVKSKIRPLGKPASFKNLKNQLGLSTTMAALNNPVPALPLARPEPRMASAPPPLARLERRTAQKLSRGQMEPESRLDLHGETLETARTRLLSFLIQRRQQGEKMVLVITGKGASPFSSHTLHGKTHFHDPERLGKLRREVPLWLEESRFRQHVVGFQPSHPRHGGGGAFYLWLRRPGN